MPITYEDFKQVQEKVEKLAASRAALCDPKGVPAEAHVEAIVAIDTAIDALKASVGGRRRKARRPRLTKAGQLAKKPGRKPKKQKLAAVAATA